MSSVFIDRNPTTGVTKITIGDWAIEANLSYSLPPQLSISSASQKTAFATYGGEVLFQNQVYKGRINDSSKLIEFVNGKVKFTEMGDEPLAPIH